MAYDIRGKVPEDLNTDLAYKIGKAYAQELTPRDMVVGYDIRLESYPLSRALIEGLTDAGVNVIDLGLCGTEEVYFNTFHLGVDGGIMITASHNPKGYNGMKLVTKGAKPISGDTGLKAIESIILDENWAENGTKSPGLVTMGADKSAYIDHLLSYVNHALLKPLKVVMNPGNGAAGPSAKLLADRLPFEVIWVDADPNGDFPHGVPNPLLPENRQRTVDAVLANQADFGIAWDGDFDRCFLFDEQGSFIEGYYLVGLLAETILKKHPGEKIIYDPRLTWNTQDQVLAAGGIAIQSKTGHAFIKERMRKEDAIYGGEMSAHHYFRDFAYCDSGMIPWLLISELMSTSGKPLSALVQERVAAYPCSGEINYTVHEPVAEILARIQNHYAHLQPQEDRTDGLGLDFGHWRLNIRASNTEPLLRLNVESKGDMPLVWQKVKEIETLISAGVPQGSH